MRASQPVFTIILTIALLAAPLATEAQPPGRAHRIGFLAGGSPGPSTPNVEQFRQGLRELGYTEGQNIVIEYRWAEGKLDRLPELAADLVRLKVDMIVAPVSTSAQAAHQATRTIPIVMIGVGDPIALGLVASLSRPGGNVTGNASYGPELVGKNLELLKEIVPDIKRVAVFWTPANPAHVRSLKDLEEPARLLAIQVLPLTILTADNFEEAFRTAATERAAAAWFFGEPMFALHRARLAALALNARLPTMFLVRQHVDAGGLVSYGPLFPDLYRRAASYVAKILKGAKPADLPVEQPTKFELVINLKTAKALGLTIPPSVLVRADEIIQ
jgi:putative ABC transport system substrate-binding protein